MEEVDDIEKNTLIPILLYHQGHRRALRIHMYQAILHAAFFEDCRNGSGDIDQFFMLSGSQGDCPTHGVSIAHRNIGGKV